MKARSFEVRQAAQLASLALENARLYAELQRSEELYRRVLENSHDLIALIDLEGRITYANSAHERVLGYGIDELVGRHASELADPTDPPLALRGRTPSLPIRRIRRKDGSWALVEGSSVLLRNPAGEPELKLVFARDVSERERIAEQLRQAQKMESIGRLAGGIAHDFNNLLTAIGGYAELGVLELDGDDIVLSSALDGHLGPIVADPTQIEQVLLNLAINARDAMSGG
ncbi:MAG: PAS domain S-box protein, partial [Gaiellaceae bacterium]